MKTTVIHHSADYDGILCREIARKFLPDAELIGWDFSDKCLPPPDCDRLFVMDLPLDRPFGFDIRNLVSGENRGECRMGNCSDIIWIDHHKSSIETHPDCIPGYRIDGVSACRLAWQWFHQECHNYPLNAGRDNCQLPTKENFINREVREPEAVLLAGEYDIWDHRGDGDLEFQFGLDAQQPVPWDTLLSDNDMAALMTRQIIIDGGAAMRCCGKRDADTVKSRSFLIEWEGLKFLALTTAKCNSNTFHAKDVPETGHDALMAFYYNGQAWNFSLYHASHRKEIDLSLIAAKHGGGGHRGACGFRLEKLPF